MQWLNYHHLLYFYTAAKEGSIAAASRELRLAQPTVSGQIKALEESFGEKLFRRAGRRLVLTEVGEIVYHYAEDIFGLGRELLETLDRRAPSPRQSVRLHVGVSDSLPKLITYRILEAALEMDPPVHLICREDKTEPLLASLAIRGLDFVLSDAPIRPSARVKAYNHLVGESPVTFFGVPKLARRYREGFPESLNGAPLLLPTENTVLRLELDHWLHRRKLQPHIVGEFEDSALLKAFGEHGAGLFVGARTIEADIQKQYGVSVVGHTDEVRERFYAVSVERRIKHPATAVLLETARERLARTRLDTPADHKTGPPPAPATERPAKKPRGR